MKALIDGDILRYEVGAGAETIAKSMDGPDALPNWDVVAALLEHKLFHIQDMTGCDAYQLYLTEGRTFRYDIAVSRPYKGKRKADKPWHYRNLTSHMVNVLGAQVVQQLEADDQLAIDHLASGGETVLCSRDKDLRQIPGFFFSWENHTQPSFGPCHIDPEGWLKMNKGKLTGSGYAFFCAQVLMGDTTDNIPGLPGWGPVKTYEHLRHSVGSGDVEDMLDHVNSAYCNNVSDWEDYLLEQGRLCWITRELNPDGTPVLWELGMTS